MQNPGGGEGGAAAADGPHFTRIVIYAAVPNISLPSRCLLDYGSYARKEGVGDEGVAGV